MNATTVAVDLAKSVFQLAVAHDDWKPVESHRLTRRQFESFFNNRAVSLVIMEACGSAHHWARWLGARGITVRLLPAAYVRAYVRRNKTDAADANALLEARIARLEQELSQLARQSQACTRLLTIPGIGLLTATAMVAATGGSVSHFRDARHFASGFGLTPREHSSGSTRKLGRTPDLLQTFRTI
jgi:transposase